MENKNCPYCGRELPEMASFCPHCFCVLVEKRQLIPVKKQSRRGWGLPILSAALLLSLALLLPTAYRLWKLEQEAQQTLSLEETEDIEENELREEIQLEQPLKESSPPQTPPRVQEETEIPQQLIEEQVIPQYQMEMEEELRNLIVSYDTIYDDVLYPVILVPKDEDMLEAAEKQAGGIWQENISKASGRIINNLLDQIVTVYQVSKEMQGDEYMILSVDCELPKGMYMSCFDPPDGDIFMLKGYESVEGRAQYNFKIPMRKLEQSEMITMKFYFDDSNDFLIVFDTIDLLG